MILWTCCLRAARWWRSGFGGFEGFGSFSDIFEDFFGDMGGAELLDSDQRGQDLKYEVDIDLERLIQDKKRNIVRHAC